MTRRRNQVFTQQCRWNNKKKQKKAYSKWHGDAIRCSLSSAVEKTKKNQKKLTVNDAETRSGVHSAVPLKNSNSPRTPRSSRRYAKSITNTWYYFGKIKKMSFLNIYSPRSPRSSRWYAESITNTWYFFGKIKKMIFLNIYSPRSPRSSRWYAQSITNTWYFLNKKKYM